MKYLRIKIFIIYAACLQISCKKFLEISPPQDKLVQETIFKTDDVATSAITGIYRGMAASGFASGDFSSITSVCGLSSDEFKSYNTILNEFFENKLTPNNSYIGSFLYSAPYKSIYAANAVLEGLAMSTGITPPVKLQLQGEALFIRAFIYFYLVNLYGPVPLHLTTDYRITQSASRTPIDQVYRQILLDLTAAEDLLSDNYVTSERIRPNKSAVQAMLARTYLYLKDWKNAEKYASLIIEKRGIYNLVDFNAVFLKNSNEAIWQLMPTANTNSKDGNLFVLVATPTYVSLRDDFVANAFEVGDKRKTSWVQTYVNTTGTYYYPFKYKIRSSTTVSEYSMVLRLAEQYLIRAEARINLEKVDLGIKDINQVRQRILQNGTIANPIPELLNSMNKEGALLALEKEKRVEFFSEWGHRWLDLKRMGRAKDILSISKPNLKLTDLLFPIPYNETSRNLNISQNDGYGY